MLTSDWRNLSNNALTTKLAYDMVSAAMLQSGIKITQKSSSEDGYGFTVGGKATMPVTKNVNVVASLERFTGQSRISNSDGNTASLGLNVKF